MSPVRLSRRRFVQGAMACGSALALAPRIAFAGSDPGAGDTLVLVVLRGGLDGMTALPPLGDGGAYQDPRRSAAVPEGRALPIDDHFGMHPAWAPIHDLYADGLVAIVPAAGSPDPSRSHFDQQAVLERGALSTADGGWLARHLSSRSATPLQSVAGSTPLPMVLHGAPASTAITSLGALTDRLRHTGDLDLGGTVLQRLAGDGSLGAAATMSARAATTLLGVPKPPESGSYPNDTRLLPLRDIAHLLAEGVAIDAAVVDVGGWDLHAGMGTVDGGPMQARLTDLGNAVAAFHADTASLSRPVTTVVMSEFGRTVALNDTGGTDHGRAGLAMAIGTGINGGRYGAWPGLSADAQDDGAVAVATDFRDVLAEIVRIRLGNPDVAGVFPGHEPTPLGLAHSESPGVP